MSAGLAKGACQSCLGTGWLLCMNSWFLADGFRRERCGICAGSGASHHPNYFPEQRRFRAANVAIRGAPADLSDAALGQIARAAMQAA
jgi:hypothetical protein